MLPVTAPRPRPPAKRNPSSRSNLAALASPSPASRSTSSSSLSTAPRPTSKLADALVTAEAQHAGLGGTCVQGGGEGSEMHRDDLEFEEKKEGEDEAGSRKESGGSTAGGSTASSNASSIPFPAATMDQAVHPSFPPHKPGGELAQLDAGEAEGPLGPLEEEVGEEESQTRPVLPVLDVEKLKELSREELERMLEEADRVIRGKEEELAVFTTAGEGLLQEYHQLRHRHDSLLARSTSTGSLSSPTRHRLSSSSSTRATPTPQQPSEAPKRRSWRTSLGFAPPAVFASGSTGSSHHRRTSSNLSFLRSARHGDGPSTPVSPSATRSGAASVAQVTPDTSPTAIRSRIVSTSSVISHAAPSSHLLFSPTTGAAEVATLGQANYSLTLQLSELEAEAEAAEREGRKKLRKLERELQTMREDLERVEQRNTMLEQEAEVAKERENDLARSVRVLSPGREQTPEVGGPSTEKDDTPRYGLGEMSWRERMKEELGSDAETSSEHSPVRTFAPSHSSDPFDRDSSTFFFTSSFLSPRRAPGNGFSPFPPSGRFSTSRSISASSLVPLPEPVELDPDLEEQQELLVEQLMAKIDELQDANEVIIAERMEMVGRLEEAQEEVAEWKERCEELEDEAVQARLIGWDAPRAAIGWHSDGGDAADADSDSPGQSIIRRKVPRRSALQQRSSRRRTITDLSRQTNSSSLSSELSDSAPDELQTPLSSPPLQESRSLCSELDGHWPVFEPPSVDPADTSALSVIIHPSRTPTDAYDSTVEVEEEQGNSTVEAPSPFPSASAISPQLQQHETRLRRHREKKDRRKKPKPSLLSSIRFGSEDEEENNGETTNLSVTLSRRDLALRRLEHEASTRIVSRPRRGWATEHDSCSSSSSASSDEGSVLSSNYDHLDAGPSTDYYPLTLRARYHPKMVATMFGDSAMRHLAVVITWVRFLVVLGMALALALWQGPKKTLGVGRGKTQRRLR
ncbi:hypothetical protein JCM8547_009092 [Rhodosporidiobolus lusitaniae]